MKRCDILNIEILNKHIIKITLSFKDMKNYSLTYEKINYNDQKTRQLIVNLLYKIKKTTKIDISKSQIFIEAFPIEENGCILYLNIINQKTINNITNSNINRPLIVKFKQIQDFKKMCQTITKKNYINKIPKNTLLQINNYPILIIYSYNKQLTKMLPIFFEYGNIIGYGKLNEKIIEEHCQLIIKSNAIETMSKEQIN